jgi:hypothetical protein
MRTVQRPRRYVSARRMTVIRPFFRYSASRRAYVLRGVGGHIGPVVRIDRRPAQAQPFDGVERRARVA